jgi:protein-S-isoprenylcysteine O-methyltransferase Ste14
MAITGPFRFSRHPSNLASMLLFSLFPRVKANRVTLAAFVTVYAALGSLHEEYRLRAAYGAAYERCQSNARHRFCAPVER